MDIETYARQFIFEEKEYQLPWYDVTWEILREQDYFEGNTGADQCRTLLAAIVLKKMVQEFEYFCYDEPSNICAESILQMLENAELGQAELEELFISYREQGHPPADPEDLLSDLLENVSEEVAELLMEECTSEDLFSYLFCVTYAFDEEHRFLFESNEEFLAFVDAQESRMEDYREEYASAYRWICSGMMLEEA